MSIWRPLPSATFWRRWLPEWMHGPLALAFKVALGLLLILAVVVTTYAMLSSEYPLEEVADIQVATTICDRDGAPFAIAGANTAVHAKRSEIPDFFIQALQAREDARFFTHHGIDHRGLLRATARNLKDLNFTQGASTLTMQLARNCFELRDPKNRSKLRELHRKLLEIAIAARIESRYSKDEILTYYLNRIYFGSGCYGIARAAETYFGKKTADLSDSECALLVGIIRGPHLYSPQRNLEGAIEQRRQTLARMREMGFIDEPTQQRLAAEAVVLSNNEQEQAQTSYVLQAVERELDQVLDEETASSGGLQVITTIDSSWQLRLEQELLHAVEGLEHESGWNHPTHAKHPSGSPPGYLQYAAFTVETQTGSVLALIGGRDFSHSRYDRSHAQRDLGSAFEPFVAAAAAENKKLVIPGKPLQTGRLAGVTEVQRVAKLCGLSGPFADNEDLFRGAASASPREMAVGLATLAHGGQQAELHLIREIRDHSGKVIYKAEPKLSPVISRDAAVDALSVLKRKSGTRIFTGATASERDAWTLRLGPSGSTAIWIGFDQPTKIASEGRLKSLLDEFVERLGND